jgi:hypothetical protein
MIKIEADAVWLFVVQLTTLFITLQLLELIDWPWVWILAPVWIWLLLIIGLILLVAAVQLATERYGE